MGHAIIFLASKESSFVIYANLYKYFFSKLQGGITISEVSDYSFMILGNLSVK